MASAQSSTDTAQGVSFVDAIRLQDVRKDVRELQGGRPRITGLPTYANGIKFANTNGSALTFQDGTTQNTAAADQFAASIFTSSFTGHGAITSTAIGLNHGACVAGSTVTLSACAGTRIRVEYLGTMQQDSGPGYLMSANFLCNGKFPTGLVLDTFINPIPSSAGNPDSVPFSLELSTSGAHTCCLTGSTTNGNGSITMPSASPYNFARFGLTCLP